MDLQASFTSSDPYSADFCVAFGGCAPVPALPPFSSVPSNAGPLNGTIVDSHQLGDAWTENFVNTLQVQHGRIRAFLEQQQDRWQAAEDELLAEIDLLKAEVRDLQAQCNLLQNNSAIGSTEALDDANRRYQMAIDDLRKLDLQNADLQRQLADDSIVSPPLSGAPLLCGTAAKVHNWEAEKQRILATLESDETAADNAAMGPQRAKIEEIILRTDRIIAEKNREIEELKHLLDSQSNSLGSLAVGAAALGGMLDMDSLIVEERARLGQLQNELQDKLRQAEIEISLERARLARREVEIEEKVRNLEIRKAAVDTTDTALAATGRPIRGRWRAQLGLVDDLPPPKP